MESVEDWLESATVQVLSVEHFDQVANLRVQLMTVLMTVSRHTM
jgi:hypothetical protein